MTGRPGVGVGVLVTRGDEVLLIKRRNVHGAGTWSAPGGHLDFGEAPENCAVREVREETSVDLASVRYCGLTNDLFEAEGKHYVTLWFEAEYLAGEPAVAAPHEMSEVGWFSWKNLPSPLFLPLENLLAGRSYQAPPEND